jgi:hypothetical protein
MLSVRNCSLALSLGSFACTLAAQTVVNPGVPATPAVSFVELRVADLTAVPELGYSSSASSSAALPVSSATTAESSSSAEISAEGPEPAARGKAAVQSGAIYAGMGHVRPFSTVAIALKLGDQGIGGELAVPVLSRLNLRAGAQFFSLNANVTSQGVQATGQLQMRNIFTSVDIYPFRNGFRISPGFTVHNDTHLTAALLAPGGTTFTLNDTDYVSDPSNPIHGNAGFVMGGVSAPRLTFGWGNMIPRAGGHFSFPFEAGFEYISAPGVTLTLAGNGCSSDGCGDINQNGGAANIAAEIVKLKNDLAPLRFYPILSTGISYRFGGGNRNTR